MEKLLTFLKIGQQNLAISDVKRAELIYDARNKRELHAKSKDTNSLQVLPIDETISGLAVELVSNFSLTHNLNLPAALISATSPS